MNKIKQHFNKTSQFVIEKMGFSIVHTGANYIKQSVRKMLVPAKLAPEESFEAVMVRENITESMLKAKKTQLLKQCLAYLLVAVAVFIYACFRLTQQHYLGFLISWLLSAMLLSFAFRAHFWLYQIKQRRLGCSLREWFYAVVSGEA